LAAYLSSDQSNVGFENPPRTTVQLTSRGLLLLLCGWGAAHLLSPNLITINWLDCWPLLAGDC